MVGTSNLGSWNGHWIVSLSLHGEKKPIRFLRSTPHGPEFIPIDILIIIVGNKH